MTLYVLETRDLGLGDEISDGGLGLPASWSHRLQKPSQTAAEEKQAPNALA